MTYVREAKVRITDTQDRNVTVDIGQEALELARKYGGRPRARKPNSPKVSAHFLTRRAAEQWQDEVDEIRRALRLF